MSIKSLQINNYKAILNNHNKIKFGEVITPFNLVKNMFYLLPYEVFSNCKLLWVDPCVGTGHFMIILYKKLFSLLSTEIKALNKRHQHIMRMLYMVEINDEHIPKLEELFGEKSIIGKVVFMD